MHWRIDRDGGRSHHLIVACLLFLLLSTICLGSTDRDIEVPAADNVKQLLKQAKKLYRKGQLVQAEAIYRKILDSDSGNVTVKLDLAYLLLKQRRIRDSFDIAFAVAKADQQNARAFAILGATFLTAGNFPEARVCFLKSLSISKKEDVAWAGFGMLAFYENRIDEGIENLREATFREPDEPDYHFALGQVSARAERYKEAADSYRRFLSVASDLDSDRKTRIRGLISFLTYLGQKSSLYTTAGADGTTVPVKLIGNRPVIQLTINGEREPLNFVLDTGSGISVISEKTARRIGVRAITKGGFAKGIGGDGRFEIVYGFVREVGIGDVKIRNVPVYIRQFHTSSENIDGYIGLSLISKFLTTIDYGNLTLALMKRADSPAGPEGENVSLPLRLTSSGFLSGEVKLEGIDDKFNFIVDTGASVSVISDDLAELQQVSQYPQGEKMRVVGSAGITDNVPSYMLPRVTFGTHSRESIAAVALDLDLINEASGFQQAGILGGNFLRNYRLTFDFRNSKVTFVPISEQR